MNEEAAQAYLAGLPRTRGAASILLLDSQDRVLVVKPTYRPGWLLPGGVIEEGESPLTACRREACEELGISVFISGLIGVDWIPPRADRDASNVFVFGGPLADEQVADIRLPPDELSDYRLATEHEAAGLLQPHIERRFGACLNAQRQGRTVYLEYGHAWPVAGKAPFKEGL